jgi:nucleoside-diphosphate-sugar epimerase
VNLIITGATGFLGRNLAQRFHAAGHQVVATGRSARAGAELSGQGIAFCPADILDAARLTEVLSPADCLIHCAGRAGDWGRHAEFFRDNVVGTRNVVQACRRRGIGRIIFVSTPSLYYSGASRYVVSESDPLPRPTTHYGRTKRVAEEELLALQAEGFEVIIFRPRAVYGPHDNTIVPRILRMAEKRRFPLVGGGRALVDLTYVDNFVDAVELSLSAPGPAWNQIYNISNGDPISVREWFVRVLAIFGRPFRPLTIPAPAALAMGGAMELASALPFGPREPQLTRFSVGYMARSLTMSIDKARDKLGYTPRVSNQEGFERYARWYRDQGARGSGG